MALFSFIEERLYVAQCLYSILCLGLFTGALDPVLKAAISKGE